MNFLGHQYHATQINTEPAVEWDDKQKAETKAIKPSDTVKDLEAFKMESSNSWTNLFCYPRCTCGVYNLSRTIVQIMIS